MRMRSWRKPPPPPPSTWVQLRPSGPTRKPLVTSVLDSVGNPEPRDGGGAGMGGQTRFVDNSGKRGLPALEKKVEKTKAMK